MKLAVFATAIAISFGVSSAAPAIVWRHGATPSGPTHLSEQIDSRSLIASSINGKDSSAISAVVFLVGRDADGSEGLTNLAGSGKLPGVQEKYNLADSIHHHVDGVESARSIVRDAKKSFDGKVAEVTLSEFNRKLASVSENAVESAPKKISKAEQRRRRDIAEADVLVVNISPKEDSSSIDSAVVAAINSSAIRNVVLSSVRSADEVKRARKLAMIDRISQSKAPRNVAARRRLDDEGEGNNANNDYYQGVYYVNMTPNIFSGILFFLMFVFTAHLGLSCMNMIEGQDVYVKKMPHIGREV